MLKGTGSDHNKSLYFLNNYYNLTLAVYTKIQNVSYFKLCDATS